MGKTVQRVGEADGQMNKGSFCIAKSFDLVNCQEREKRGDGGIEKKLCSY